ncbi:MAG: hypothetical protein ABJ387_03500 [Balneola sp.]
MIEKRGNINMPADRKKIEDAIEAELYDFGQDLVATAVDYLERKNINMDGDIMKSVQAEVEKLKDDFRLQFGANVRHAIYVHEGTKPHWAPVKPIRQWVHKKLNLRGKELKNVTFLVRRKIAREGTKAKPFLAVAMRAHINRLGGRIGQAIEKAAA